jgi:hypothetical protein
MAGHTICSHACAHAAILHDVDFTSDSATAAIRRSVVQVACVLAVAASCNGIGAIALLERKVDRKGECTRNMHGQATVSLGTRHTMDAVLAQIIAERRILYMAAK